MRLALAGVLGLTLVMPSAVAADAISGQTIQMVKDGAALVVALVAMFTVGRGIMEYRRQGAQKRAEHFMALRDIFKSTESFRDICALLERDKEELGRVPFKDRRDLIGFFELIALMTNSRLMPREVSQYMFGYYARRCWESKHFWEGIKRQADSFSLFRDYAEEAVAMRESFQYDREKYRF